MQFLKSQDQTTMLFADFFAAVAMLFILLINTVDTIRADPVGTEDAETLHIEIDENNQWSWGENHNLLPSESIPLLPKGALVQLNVASDATAESLFSNFQKLHQAGINYSFSTKKEK